MIVTLWRSVLARPLTTLYLFASAAIIAASAGWIAPPTAIVSVGLMFIAMLTLGLHRENVITAEKVQSELTNIHDLVNSQHDELVARVEQLIRVLEQADVKVPEPREKGTP